jgi:ADP-ribose pyrophosphatase
MKIPKKISEQIVADNWFRQTIEKKFEFVNWKKWNFLIASHYWKKEAVTVLALTELWEILYLKEFRYWPEEFLINFPMGAVEKNDSELKTVDKELKEETWYISNNVEYIWETIVANYEKSIQKMYIAKNCTNIWKQNLEIWENIEVFKTSIEEFEKMILDWKVRCPITISCFYIAKNKGLI